MKYERRPIRRPDLQGYTVTNYGEVYNEYGQAVTPWQDSRGKLTVTIKGKWHVVDRLVANAFVESDGEKFLVEHLDDDENNCRADNLIWVGTPEKEPVSSPSQKQKKEVVFDPDDKDGIQGWNEDGELVERFPNVREFCEHYYEGKPRERKSKGAGVLRRAIKEGIRHQGLYWVCYDQDLLYYNPIYAPRAMEDEVIDDDTLNEVEPIGDMEDTTQPQDIEDIEPTMEKDEVIEPTIEEEEEEEPIPATPAEDETPQPTESHDANDSVDEPIVDDVKEEEVSTATPAKDKTKLYTKTAPTFDPTDTDGIQAWRDGKLVLRFKNMSQLCEYLRNEMNVARDPSGNIRKAMARKGSVYGFNWVCYDPSLLYIVPPRREEYTKEEVEVGNTTPATDAPQATQSHDVSEPIESATMEEKRGQRANDEVKEVLRATHSVIGESRTIRVTTEEIEVAVVVKAGTKQIKIELN